MHHVLVALGWLPDRWESLLKVSSVYRYLWHAASRGGSLPDVSVGVEPILTSDIIIKAPRSRTRSQQVLLRTHR